MKKIIIIAIVLLFASCSNPLQTVPEPDSQLIGTWARNDRSFRFVNDGTFQYFNNITGVLYNDGYFVELDGEFYLGNEDDGLSMYYWYEIIGDSLWVWLDSYIEHVEYIRTE